MKLPMWPGNNCWSR